MYLEKNFLSFSSVYGSRNTTEEYLLEAFKVYDRDNDGFISHDELRQAMQQLSKRLFEWKKIKGTSYIFIYLAIFNPLM
jgi:Ca2+-binding EF-hand superfamily protein